MFDIFDVVDMTFTRSKLCFLSTLYFTASTCGLLGKGVRIRYIAQEKQEENNLSSLQKMKKVPPFPRFGTEKEYLSSRIIFSSKNRHKSKIVYS
jgi:hypothetical protein